MTRGDYLISLTSTQDKKRVINAARCLGLCDGFVDEMVASQYDLGLKAEQGTTLTKYEKKFARALYTIRVQRDRRVRPDNGLEEELRRIETDLLYTPAAYASAVHCKPVTGGKYCLPDAVPETPKKKVKFLKPVTPSGSSKSPVYDDMDTEGGSPSNVLRAIRQAY